MCASRSGRYNSLAGCVPSSEAAREKEPETASCCRRYSIRSGGSEWTGDGGGTLGRPIIVFLSLRSFAPEQGARINNLLRVGGNKALGWQRASGSAKRSENFLFPCNRTSTLPFPPCTRIESAAQVLATRRPRALDGQQPTCAPATPKIRRARFPTAGVGGAQQAPLAPQPLARPNGGGWLIIERLADRQSEWRAHLEVLVFCANEAARWPSYFIVSGTLMQRRSRACVYVCVCTSI